MGFYFLPVVASLLTLVGRKLIDTTLLNVVFIFRRISAPTINDEQHTISSLSTKKYFKISCKQILCQQNVSICYFHTISI